MTLDVLYEIINKVVLNKTYKETIFNYIKELTKDKYLLFQEEFQTTISNFEMNEYLSINIYGPEEIQIEMNYCNKKENFVHKLNIDIDKNDNTYVFELKNNNQKFHQKEEEYKNNNLSYCYDIKDEKETSTTVLKEMVFNDRNIAFACVKKFKKDMVIKEDYYVSKIKNPYIFKTEKNNKEYSGTVITSITKKQYQKATEYILKEENKFKQLVKKLKIKK